MCPPFVYIIFDNHDFLSNDVTLYHSCRVKAVSNIFLRFTWQTLKKAALLKCTIYFSIGRKGSNEKPKRYCAAIGNLKCPENCTTRDWIRSRYGLCCPPWNNEKAKESTAFRTCRYRRLLRDSTRTMLFGIFIVTKNPAIRMIRHPAGLVPTIWHCAVWRHRRLSNERYALRAAKASLSTNLLHPLWENKIWFPVSICHMIFLPEWTVWYTFRERCAVSNGRSLGRNGAAKGIWAPIWQGMPHSWK